MTTTPVDTVRYSVSVMCLTDGDRLAAVRALRDAPVSDLHCDAFPSLTAARSLRGDEISALREVWHRRLTIHYWNDVPGGNIGAAPRPGDRLLLEHVYRDAETLEEEVERFSSLGWQVGVSIQPHKGMLPARLLDGGNVKAVQILSTDTPGAAGGRFHRDAIEFVKSVAAEVERSGLNVSVELDGGVDASVVDMLKGHCSLFVLGTNASLDRAGKAPWFDPALNRILNP